MLTIEGFTAQGLADAHGFNMLQAYDALLTLKEDPSNAGKFGGAAGQDSVPGGSDDVDTTEKKGLFGKLFKKYEKILLENPPFLCIIVRVRNQNM